MKQSKFIKKNNYPKPKAQNDISYIEIPSDTYLDWNTLPKYNLIRWRKIEDPEEIERNLIARNKTDFDQAIEFLKYFLSIDSHIFFGDSILTGNYDISNISLINLQNVLLPRT